MKFEFKKKLLCLLQRFFATVPTRQLSYIVENILTILWHLKFIFLGIIGTDDNDVKEILLFKPLKSAISAGTFAWCQNIEISCLKWSLMTCDHSFNGWP